jgi:hypothetical protein
MMENDEPLIKTMLEDTILEYKGKEGKQWES